MDSLNLVSSEASSSTMQSGTTVSRHLIADRDVAVSEWHEGYGNIVQ